MTDELDSLLARARELERENSLLRSIQSPSGGEAALRAENAMLMRELDLAQAAPSGPARPDEAGERPRSLEAFNALPPDERRAAALRMTSEERDALLGRGRAGHDLDNYL
jgi:hypothetical protein